MSLSARVPIAIVIAAVLAARGFNKQSLDGRGAIAAFLTGLIAFSASLRYGVTLIAFYYAGTKLTKVDLEKKTRITDEYASGTERGLSQVLCCSVIATFIALIQLYIGDERPIDFSVRPFQSFLACAYLGHYACCSGDTWASELGVLSEEDPYLITSLPLGRKRRVPRGTNGGVTLAGTVAATAGGTLIGLVFFFMGLFVSEETDKGSAATTLQPNLILLGMMAGFWGSCLDSFIGSVFQATFYDKNRKIVVSKPTEAELRKNRQLILISGTDLLTNEQVNLVSTFIITILSGMMGRALL